jgi:hypothetical protein
MEDVKQSSRTDVVRRKSHMPQHSIFFEKVVPILLIGMGVVTAALVLFAAGVLLGIVKF